MPQMPNRTAVLPILSGWVLAIPLSAAPESNAVIVRRDSAPLPSVRRPSHLLKAQYRPAWVVTGTRPNR